MLFNKRKMKEHRKIRFSDVENIVMETEGMHFELLPIGRVVKYRNVISPQYGNMVFSDGYFDEKKAMIPQDDMKLISATFDRMFQRRTPEKDLLPLPIGAIYDAYMRISLRENMVAYYTNTHTIEAGFRVKIEPVAAEFIQLIQLLKQHCSFQEFTPEGIPMKHSSKLLNKINADIECDKINRIIGYRFEATGVLGYEFYNINDKICSVSSVVAPSESVRIFGNGVTWRSDFENCTIFPGLTRNINDESNGKQVFQIVYKGIGEYEINESILVYCDMWKYTFYCDDKIIATINKISNKSNYLQKPSDTYYDYDPYFEIAADNGINAELLMVIQAFPMLRFAL